MDSLWETVVQVRSTRTLMVEGRHSLGFVCTIAKVGRVYALEIGIEGNRDRDDAGLAAGV